MTEDLAFNKPGFNKKTKAIAIPVIKNVFLIFFYSIKS